MPDTENCLLCHRYPMLGRYDKQGRKNIFYVNEKLYARSVHGSLKCTNCHIGLDKIPHTGIKKVNCSTKCHIVEPSTNREFSHVNMVNNYNASVHGIGTGETLKPFPEDLPSCKYCHDNRILNPVAEGMWGKSEALSNETLARCVGCHTKAEWAEKFYSHFTHRMRKRRTQSEIVDLCTSCHEDQDKMARHGLESIETFKDTFHWTQVKYKVENAPDCISCHVPLGYSTHDIRPREDFISPINTANRVKTCSNQGGVQICHPGATNRFAKGRVHAYGMKAQIAAEKTGKIETGEGSLVLKRARADMDDDELFHYKVIELIKLLYKILIALVIGSMSVHQVLDYIRTRKNHKAQHQGN